MQNILQMQNIPRILLIVLSSLIYIAVSYKNDVREGDESKNNRNGDRNGIVTVETSLGTIEGLQNGLVNSFLGIPFAQPPINALRFRPPKTKRPWYPDVIQAFKFGPECLQSAATGGGGEDDLKMQNEDCLYINIWQPAGVTSESLLPVLLWIYGGAFLHGSTGRPEYIGNKVYFFLLQHYFEMQNYFIYMSFSWCKYL